jgi:two-component system, sporulation sensor kinase E
MHTTLSETRFNAVHVQVLGTKEQTRATPSKGVSKASALTGLAHLIHQISNPIQAVSGAASLMDQELPTNDRADPFLGQVFQQLKGGVDQLISLVSGLRSQLEGLWLTDPDFDSVNLNSLIDDILQGEAVRFDAGGIRVWKHIAANLPPIQANEKLLKQALVNLLRNAADAMPEGGLLRIKSGVNERSVFFELADTGGGIPPDLDVFQPFATTKSGAMGLGLTITRHIVESHNGTITYGSQPGEGTTFCLTFPWAPEAKKVSV